MNSRVADITSQVRLELGQIGVQDLQDGEIHRKMKRVIRDILRDIKPIEKKITITTVEDQEAYDISDEGVLLLKPGTIETSWELSLRYVDNISYHDYSTTGSDYPSYMTLMNNSVYLRPIPGNAGDTIDFWAYQTDSLVDIDEDTPPEIPEYLDEAIILGVCAQYNRDKFLMDYENEKSKWKAPVHQKVVSGKQTKTNW